MDEAKTPPATVNVKMSPQKTTWFEELGERLVLRPSFQRRAVWSDEQKSFLIDTILRGLPVPEIYLYSEPDERGRDKYYIIDGQQRLRACIEFMNDVFAVSYDVNRLSAPFDEQEIPWMDLRFSSLSPGLQRKFRQYQFNVRELEGASTEEIRHIFYRVNQSSYALNPQELRFSMYEGGLLALAERLALREEWQHFRLFTLNQRRRMLDTEFISELIVGYLHWPQNKKDNLDHYYRQYGSSLPRSEAIYEQFVSVLELLARVFPEARMNRTRWYKKSDFYTLFILLAKNRVQIENAQALQRYLTEFSVALDASVDYLEGSPVQVYAEAVARAATDRARRIRREEALVAYLQGVESVDVSFTEQEEDGPGDEEDSQGDDVDLVGLGDVVEADMEEDAVYEDAEPIDA